MYDLVQLLRRRKVRMWLGLGVAVLIVLGVAVQLLGPIDPYHRAVAHALRAEFDAIPRYPGSTITTYSLKASLADPISSITVGYAASASCGTIQDYYRTTLQDHAWIAKGTPQVLHTDQDPAHDQIESLYAKATETYTVGWSVSCFVDSSFQPGYSIVISSPPLQQR